MFQLDQGFISLVTIHYIHGEYLATTNMELYVKPILLHQEIRQPAVQLSKPAIIVYWRIVNGRLENVAEIQNNQVKAQLLINFSTEPFNVKMRKICA